MRDLAWLAVLAVFGISANQLLFVQGLLRAGPINAVVLVVIIPVVSLLVATLLGRERPSLRRALGLAVTLAGVLILVRAERFDLSDRKLIGNLLLLANTTCYAIYLVLAKPIVSRLGPLPSIGWLFLFGALEAAPWTVPAVASTPWATLDAGVWLALAFVLIGPTIGAYFLNAYALTRVDSSVVALFTGLQPMLGALASWWLLGEIVSLRAAIAGVVIVAGVVIATVPRWSVHPTR